MIDRYRKYLEYIDEKLAGMFENQKQYIKCKKGCAFCCKEGIFPLSELEFLYLMLGYIKLDNKTKDFVNERIANLLEKDRKKYYECPFLKDNICSVYSSRPIICRTFGLIYYNKKERFKMPFCVDLGLNYSDVYNSKIDKFNDNFENDKNLPLAFNIERSVLRSPKIEQKYELFFGEDKSMAEWLKEEFS